MTIANEPSVLPIDHGKEHSNNSIDVVVVVICDDPSLASDKKEE